MTAEEQEHEMNKIRHFQRLGSATLVTAASPDVGGRGGGRGMLMAGRGRLARRSISSEDNSHHHSADR